jgi:hypothetical protein
MNDQTEVSIQFKNSITKQKALKEYVESLKQINSYLSAIDTGKAKAVEDVAKSTNKMANKSTTDGVKTLGNNLTTAFNVTKLIAFRSAFERTMKEVSTYTKKSADFLENWNLLDVAFQNNTTEAEKFVNTLTEMYGLDESWAYRTVGIFKQLSNAMGLTDEVGTKLSKTLTQLAIDTSSLYNIDVEDTVSILQSGLAGQTKPVRRLGGDITQTTLQLTLDAYGIDETINQLTYAEKRLVIVTALLNQTEEASGDWGRTIDSVANQMRIFQQQVERLTRAIGNVFLPILKAILPYMNAIIMVLTEIISWFALLVGYDPDEFDFFSGASDSVIDLKENLDGAGESAKKLKSGLRSFDKLNVIKTPTASGSGGGMNGVDPKILEMFNKASDDYLNNLDKVEMKATKIRDKIMEWLGFTKLVDKKTGDISFKFEKLTSGSMLGALIGGGAIFSGISKLVGLIGKLTGFEGITLVGGSLGIILGVAGAVGILAYSLYDLYQKNDEFAQSFDKKWQGIQEALEPIKEDIVNLFDTLKTTYEETLKPMIEEIYEIIQTIATTLLEVLSPVFQDFIFPILDQVIQIVTDVFNIINELWKKYGKPISDAVKEAIQGVADIFMKLWEQFLSPIIEKIKEIIDDLWANTLSPMFKKVGEAVGSVIEFILALWNNVLEPIVKWLINVLAPTFDTIFSFVADVIHTAVKFIGGIINGLLDVFIGVIDFLVGVFTLDFEKALDGIVKIFKGIVNIIISIAEGMVNGVISLINLAIKGIFNGVKSFVNSVLGTIEGIADFIGEDIDITLKAKAPQIPKVTIPRLKTGLDFVPNDYYPAYLDYGERVLTKEENADYNKGIINGKNSLQPFNATFIIQVGNEELTTKVLDDLQSMARSNGEPITIGA